VTEHSRPRETNRNGIWNGLRRLVRFRLVIPVLRARHSPEYTARGVFVGLIVAMTPTVGVQMAIVAAIWLAVRLLRPSWNFSPVVAALWTWVTNIFTLAPIYYIFLITGQLMMGRWGGTDSYDMFADRLNKLLATDATWLESLWIYAVEMFTIWGVPMFVGSIPWAIVCGWLGYRWSLSVARTVHRRRKRRTKARPVETADLS
jgi:uncharacterized protein (DUF2062 family)